MRRLIVAAVILLALGGGGFYVWGRARAATAQGPGNKGPAPVPVLAAAVVTKDVPIYLDALGTVQAYASVTVRTQVDGQILHIAFKEGQDVHKGELLAQIDPAPLQAQLDQAIAHKKQDEAKIGQDHAKVNQDQAKSKQDMAKKVQDEASLANAKVTLKRYEDTVVANAVTRQQVDDARTAVATLTAQVDGDAAAIEADEAATQADSAAIQADEATVLADDANIKYQQSQLAYTKILSPIDGRIGIRFVDEGNVVHTNDTNGIVLVTQLQPISVLFTLPEEDLLRINEQMAHGRLAVYASTSRAGSNPQDNSPLALDRFDPNSPKVERGELEVVDNQIDQSTKTIRLKATFANQSRKLWPGGFVDTRLLIETRKQASVIPAPAVQQGPDGDYVFLIKGEQVEAQPVKVALIQDNEAVIESGLQPADSVVLSGQDRLKSGSHVTIQGTKKKSEVEPNGSKSEAEHDAGAHPHGKKGGDKPETNEPGGEKAPANESSGGAK